MAEVGIATIAPPLLPFVLINYKSALIMANKVIDEGALASSRFSISFETFFANSGRIEQTVFKCRP